MQTSCKSQTQQCHVPLMTLQTIKRSTEGEADGFICVDVHTEIVLIVEELFTK